MSMQDDFQKVQKYIIGPMTRMYHPPAHLRNDTQAFEEVIREYHRVLNGLPAVALEKGWEQVKADHKTWNWPHFQTIRDTCDKYKPVQLDAPETPRKKDQFYCMGHTEKEHPQKALAILSSAAGQLALSSGVGRDLLTEYEISGRMEFDNDFVLRMSISHQKNCENLSAIKPNEILFKLYELMMERERRLYAEFFIAA